jgi:outer membrane receptor protein involved in Fe transport
MRPRILVLAAVLLAASAAGVLAQTTGTINGRVLDSQGLPVPGATVTVTGAQGSKTTTTSTDGRFQMPYLVPGTYKVKIELDGFKTAQQEDLSLRLGQTIDLPITMTVGGVAETVNVTGAPPVVDTTTTTIGAALDSQLLERVPIGRRFSDTLYMAPGVSSSGTAGTANPSVSGASGLDNQYVVDGVNITNGGYGALGSYSIIFGSLGSGTPYDFIQEVQVKTGGYEAEYGQATGGVINVITKSGGNQFTGTLFAYSRPSGTESGYTQVQTPNGSVNTQATSFSDTGFAIGGPILHNRLFFFAAADPSYDRTTFTAPTNTDPVTGAPLFGLSSLGGVDRIRKIYNYAAKGTYQLNSNHRIDVSVFGDPARGDNGPQRVTAMLSPTTSRFSSLEYGGNNQTVRYQATLSSRMLVEASFAHADNRIAETPSVEAWSVTDRTVTPNIVSGGIGRYEAGNESRSWQYQGIGTSLFGGHELRYGVQYDRLDYDATNQITGPTFTTPVGDQTATGAQIQILPDPVYGQVYRVVRANLNATKATNQSYVSFFAQDTWKVGDRLTIKPGIRYEQETLNGTLVQNFKLKNNWAPRVGVTFDPTGGGRSKVYGSFGIFYQRVPNDLAARALSADAGIAADYFDAQLTQPIPNGIPTGPSQSVTHYSIAGAGADLIDPNAKLTFMREYLGGFEQQLRGNMSVGVRYVHRSIPRVLEDVSPFPIVAADLGIPGADSVDYTLTNPGPNTPTSGNLGASFEAPVHRYDAVEFTLDKRFSKQWAMQASYRWSRLWGNYEGSYRDDNGQSDPGITSLFDFPQNDPSYSAIGVPQFGYLGDVRYLGSLGNGPLPLDRTHQAKVFGNYEFKMGINVGLGLNLSSGKPLTGLASNPNPNYQNGGEIPTGVRGSGIQTVDGFKTRTPFQSEVSAHVDYSFKFGGPRRAVLLMDVFNLFNQQTVLDYDTWVESTFGAANPNLGYPTTSAIGGNPPQYQTPRQFRFGVRFQF